MCLNPICSNLIFFLPGGLSPGSTEGSRDCQWKLIPGITHFKVSGMLSARMWQLLLQCIYSIAVHQNARVMCNNTELIRIILMSCVVRRKFNKRAVWTAVEYSYLHVLKQFPKIQILSVHIYLYFEKTGKIEADLFQAFSSLSSGMEGILQLKRSHKYNLWLCNYN